MHPVAAAAPVRAEQGAGRPPSLRRGLDYSDAGRYRHAANAGIGANNGFYGFAGHDAIDKHNTLVGPAQTEPSMYHFFDPDRFFVHFAFKITTWPESGMVYLYFLILTVSDIK
jgi:hypothetical protein